MFKPKHLKLAIIPIILLAVIIVAVTTYSDDKTKPAAAQAKPVTACGPYRSDRVVHINGQAFKTEVAASSAEFDKGLGGRPCILPNQAMLFAFKQPGQYAFWMKDMKFPIDIIWVGPDYKVAAIEINESPSTYPDKFVNQKDRPAQYVLEVKANRTKELNIQIGTAVAF